MLAELVGEDHDDDSAEISRIRSDMWTVSGSTDVSDFVEETGIAVPEGEYHTIAGFIMSSLGHVPCKGEELRHDSVVFSVSKMEGRRVVEVSVRIEEVAK